MPTNKTKVALVEDNEMVRSSYASLLEMHGFQVACFDTAEALLAQDWIEFDCLIVDLRLPRMNGYQLIQEMRTRGFVNRVILVSGNIDVQMKDRVGELDNVCLLNKPCMRADFIEIVSLSTIRKSAG